MSKEITIQAPPETIVIFGAPGSGKDTQAEFLVKTLGYQIISTGELARILAEHDEEVRELMKKGELLSDSIIEDELISAFLLLPEDQPVILDGYPRNLEQATKLMEILKKNGRKLDKAIFIQVSDTEIIKRLGSRRICLSCGRLTTKKEGEVCHECGGKLVTREDDAKQAIKERIKVFHTKTEPMIKYLKEQGILVEIDGNPTPEMVKEEIRKSL